MSAEPLAWECAALLAQVGDDQAALDLARDLIMHDPSPEVFEVAASITARRGEVDDAIALYRQGLALYPHDQMLAINGARLLRGQPGHADEALAILEGVIAHHPDNAGISHSRTETLRIDGRLELAESAVRTHIARFPDHGGGHLTLALILFEQGKLNAALTACEAVMRFPDHAADAHEIAANAHVALGDARGALASYRQAIERVPDAELHSRLLMSMMYCDDVPVAAIQAEAQRWAEIHTSGIASRWHWPHLDFVPERRLKVGFVSGDFRQCSTPHLAFPLWEKLPADWEVTLYDTAPATDDWGERFRAASAEWRDVSNLADDAVCDLVTADTIDVLFDLNGHTLGGRPGLFHRKPAPVQIAWLDFVGTTGLRTFDAIIGDAHHLPLADQGFYGEPIRHVRDNLYRYHPPADALPVGPLPAASNGRITFGCFNSAYKLSPSVLDLWSTILLQLPHSVLLLQSREYGSPDACDRFRAGFARRGVDPGRIVLRPGAPTPRALMASYAEIDIALDPFPYSGGLTTIEALFMGVPVVTMPGDRFGSRHSTAHLRAVGLDDWIAADREAYVATVLRKAAQLDTLSDLRRGLRRRLLSSALCNGMIAHDMEAIVSDLWEKVCRRQRLL